MDWLVPILVRIADLGWRGPIAFVALYVVATVLPSPAFVLTIAAGAVWGLWRGTLLAYIGAVVGSSVVYAIAAPFGRSRLLRWLDRDPRVAAVRQAVVGQGLWIMFLLRLSPLVPYVLLNYALALSGVRYRDYLIASVGMLPTIVVYAYYGKLIGDVAVVAAGVAPPRGTGYYVLLVIGLVATVAATTMITRAARRAIERQRGM